MAPAALRLAAAVALLGGCNAIFDIHDGLPWPNGCKDNDFMIDDLQVLLAIWGSGPDDVWAVGDLGTIVRWNGTIWSVVPATAIQ